MATPGGAGRGGEPKDVTQDESKQLRRVFDTLCDFAAKHKLEKQRKPKQERKTKILAYKKNPEAVRIVDETGRDLTNQEIEAELQRIDAEIDDIDERIRTIEDKPNKKIAAKDLMEALAKLGKKASKVSHCLTGHNQFASSRGLVIESGVEAPFCCFNQREVQDMIWEVDENLDEHVDWEEFQLMFHRNIKDTTGLEPSQLFNVVQFMMYDKDGGGEVSVDETMHMLYSRYGRERLEAEMHALFGERLSNTGDGVLTFPDYLAAVNLRLPKKGRRRGNAAAAAAAAAGGGAKRG